MSARLLVLAAAVLFGTTGTAQALGPEASPLLVGAARIAVGALLLLAIARWAGAPLPRRPCAVAGMAIGIAIYSLAFFAGVQRTGVAIGTVVAIGTGPAVAGGLGALVNGEHLSRRWLVSTMLAITGVGLLTLGGTAGGDTSVDVVGVALAAVAGAGYGSYTVVAKRMLSAGETPEGMMAAGFAGAAVLLLPVLVLGGSELASVGGISLALYLGAIPTALAYVLFARGLRELGSGDTATIVLAEPVTATALGIIVLGESFAALTLAGSGLVLAALVVLAVGATSEVDAPRPQRR